MMNGCLRKQRFKFEKFKKIVMFYRNGSINEINADNPSKRKLQLPRL